MGKEGEIEPSSLSPYVIQNVLDGTKENTEKICIHQGLHAGVSLACLFNSKVYSF